VRPRRRGDLTRERLAGDRHCPLTRHARTVAYRGWANAAALPQRSPRLPPVPYGMRGSTPMSPALGRHSAGEPKRPESDADARAGREHVGDSLVPHPFPKPVHVANLRAAAWHAPHTEVYERRPEVLTGGAMHTVAAPTRLSGCRYAAADAAMYASRASMASPRSTAAIWRNASPCSR